MSRLLDALRAHRDAVEADLDKAREKGAHTAVASLQRHLYTLVQAIAAEEKNEKPDEMTPEQIVAAICDGIWALDDAGAQAVLVTVQARLQEGRR